MKQLAFACVIFCIFSCKIPTPINKNWTIGPFKKPKENPVLKADSSYIFISPIDKKPVRWQKADVFNPAAIVRHDTIYVLFRAEDNPAAGIGGRTSRIGIAFSTDGLNFQKHTMPVLFPDSSRFMLYDLKGGCEDPRIVENEEGNYVLMYTSWDTKVARLSVATSTDLFHWQKQGPAFTKAYNGKYLNIWSKSGSIVTYFNTIKKRFLAKKINGKYYMYYGEGTVKIATSENLIDWMPLENDKAEVLNVLQPRPHKFDSELCEPGPPAVYTNKGIVLLYNGKNAKGINSDTTLDAGTYCGGQALFDSTHPEKLLAQADNYFIKPDLPHEKSGQYAAGTTFIEGLVFFNGQLFLYYGTADSMVGVATKKGSID